MSNYTRTYHILLLIVVHFSKLCESWVFVEKEREREANKKTEKSGRPSEILIDSQKKKKYIALYFSISLYVLLYIHTLYRLHMHIRFKWKRWMYTSNSVWYIIILLLWYIVDACVQCTTYNNNIIVSKSLQGSTTHTYTRYYYYFVCVCVRCMYFITNQFFLGYNITNHPKIHFTLHWVVVEGIAA